MAVTPTPPTPIVPEYPALGAPDFNQKAYAYGTGMPAVVNGTQAIAVAAQSNALYAEDRAAASDARAVQAERAAAAAETSAQTAALIAGAQRWQPGDYAQGAVVWSPLSLLTYRRVPEGVTASTTDPSLDPSAWRLSGSPHSMPTQELSGPGPHQLATGMHYLLLTADVVAVMPATAFAQEQLRITNLSGYSGQLLQRNGQAFSGQECDLVLNVPTVDRIFVFTATKGWV